MRIMKEVAKLRLMEVLLPDEKTWDHPKMTIHDQLMVLGWNMYREELLLRFKNKTNS